MGDSNSKRLLQEELLQGLELAKQLQIYFQLPSSSKETHELLIQRIISTFEKALQTLNWKGESSKQHRSVSGIGIGMSESPPLSGSEDSDRDFKDQDGSRKRNTVARWTKQIRVTPGVGVEGPLDDGYSWRKYGQKDILGATYPRGYYRCTHRNVQGCLATKQVQRSDEDPTVFEITYRGKHTCMAASNVVVPPLENTNPLQQQLNNVLQSLQQKPNEVLTNLRESLRVQTQNLDSPNQSFPPAPAAEPFYFPSTSELNPSSLHQQQLQPTFAENFYSASYNNISPATSAISNFSMSPTSYGSQINDIIPAAASSANSPTVGLEIPFDHFQFDAHNFTFDNTRFFS